MLITRYCCLLFLLLSPAFAQSELEKAKTALREGLPEVALKYLEESKTDTPSAKLLYAEALIKSGRGLEAVEMLETLRTEEEARRQFLLGESYSSIAYWQSALKHYQSVPENAPEAAFAKRGAALMLRKLGQHQDALALMQGDPLAQAEIELELGNVDTARTLLQSAVLETVSDKKIAIYLTARIHFSTGKFAEADATFGEILQDRLDVPLPVFIGSAIGQAQSRIQLETAESAAKPLENAIELFTDNPVLETLFRELDGIYSRQSDPSDSELQTWRESATESLRQGLAILYLGNFRQRQALPENATVLWQQLLEQSNDKTIVARAVLKLAALRLEYNQLDALLEMAPLSAKLLTKRQAAEFAFLLGKAHYRRRNFEASAECFAIATPELGEVARFNSALVQLARGDYDGFLESYKQFSIDFPDSPRRQELILEEGILQASQLDEKAAQTLALFIRDFPEHPRVADAWIASAELSYLKGDIVTAQKYLDKAGEAPPTKESGARGDYLLIILEEAQPPVDFAKLIPRARQWLEKYPASSLREDARMKLGELYYQSEDYLNAQTQFQNVATEFSNSPIAEKALFLAAQSAIRSRATDSQDIGLDLFEAVYRRNGAMKLRARLEQAGLKARAGAWQEAIVLYDSVLNDDPTTDIRMEAMVGKGEALFNLGAQEEEFYKRAENLFRRAAKDPDASRYWRNQAFWKRGQTLEKMGLKDDALLAYHQALEEPNDGTPEYFWFYKCGFDAARLLEGQKKWKTAVALYAKLAALPGPRADEAKQRQQRLQLQHFIWDEF